MRKRLLLFISAFVLCINASFAIEQVNDVYQIATADDLSAFATLVNGGTNSASAVVKADITASSDFTPIGSSESNKYTGTFDGGGYTITLSINNSSSDNQGLFGVIGAAKISNVKVAGSVKGKANVGGVVGYVRADGGTITNCHNYAAVTASGDQVGGIAGYAYQYGCTISECTNNAAISGGNEFVGGILGRVDYGSVTIEKCINYGDLSCSNANVAGIIGWANSRTTESGKGTYITACANRGKILSGKNAGAIIGYFDYNFYMTSCYNESDNDASLKLDAYTDTDGTKTYTNCYNINSVSGDIATGTFTSNEITSGALCYKLNGGSTGNLYWYQTLGENGDTHPVLTAAKDGSNIVYAGYANCNEDSYGYSNNQSDVQYDTPPAHVFGNDGVCTGCGQKKTDLYYVLTGATVENATVAITVTRDDATVTLTNGSSKVKVGETLYFTITPYSGYYFSDGKSVAKETTIELVESNISDNNIVVSLSDYAVHQHSYGTDGNCTICKAVKTYTLADYSNASTYSKYVTGGSINSQNP